MSAKASKLLALGGLLLSSGCSEGKSPADPTYNPLSVTTTSLSEGVQDEPYADVITATGGDGSYSWSVAAGSLPTGLGLAATGAITGTPTGAGDTFTVRVSSGDGQTAQRELSITVYPPLVVTTATLPDGIVGEAYDETLTASGADGTYSWTVALGSLPAGLTLASDGRFTGTPTVAGTESFTVEARSGNGQSAEGALSITVEPQQLLFENFEDGALDPRITVVTAGAFGSSPGILDRTEFGSTKAFGFGRSVCGASCFFNYVTTLVITFAAPTPVSTISFNEMELFDNWGSDGSIHIDGSPWDTGFRDFGRLPYNDRQADTTFRQRSFEVNADVTVIEIRVVDITNLSEIFLDDLSILGR